MTLFWRDDTTIPDLIFSYAEVTVYNYLLPIAWYFQKVLLYLYHKFKNLKKRTFIFFTDFHYPITNIYCKYKTNINMNQKFCLSINRLNLSWPFYHLPPPWWWWWCLVTVTSSSSYEPLPPHPWWWWCSLLTTTSSSS